MFIFLFLFFFFFFLTLLSDQQLSSELDQSATGHFPNVKQIGTNLGLKTQFIEAESIVAPYPPHNAELEILFLARRRPPADVPLVGTEDFPEAFAAAIAAPALASRRNGDRDAAARRMERKLVDDAAR